MIEEQRRLGRHRLRTSIGFYRKQLSEGRLFLHEHPNGADSWDDQEMVDLQMEEGVYTVTGPMCFWNKKVFCPKRGEGVVKKMTKFVTNSRRLAEALDQRCRNQTGGPQHKHLVLIGNVASGAAKYSPEFVMEVLGALRKELLDRGTMSSLDMMTGGPVPTQPLFEGSTLDLDVLQELCTMFDSMSGESKCYDDISGEELPKHFVDEARAVEMGWVRDIGLYDKVPRTVAQASGIKPRPVMLVDVNKGDKENYKMRCRLVGKELKAKTKETLLAHQLFSAMPPWEAAKTLLSLLVADGVDGAGDSPEEELEMAIFDISRAHFMPKCKRELYIELPPEDRTPGDGDLVGRLNRNMYGFRDAADGWSEDWQQTLGSVGFEVGVANPALFHRAKVHTRGAVHGDDSLRSWTSSGAE